MAKVGKFQAVYQSIQFKKAKRIAHIRDNWQCQMCDKQVGTKDEPAVGDHIKRLSEAWELRYDHDNIETLCRSCHSKWKQIHERDKSIASDKNGNPIDPNDIWYLPQPE